MAEALAVQSEHTHMTCERAVRNHKHRQSQVNARIDADLKEAGDAALAEVGYTPTQAVRALWTLAQRHRDDPAKIRAVLDGTDDGVSADKLAEQKRRREALERAVSLIPTFLEEQGISTTVDPVRAGITDDEYYEMLKEEHFIEKGYLS